MAEETPAAQAIDRATAVRSGEQLDLAALEAYLAATLPPADRDSLRLLGCSQ